MARDQAASIYRRARAGAIDVDVAVGEVRSLRGARARVQRAHEDLAVAMVAYLVRLLREGHRDPAAAFWRSLDTASRADVHRLVVAELKRRASAGGTTR